MKRIPQLSGVASLLTCLAMTWPAHADDGGGSAMRCIGANTYLPRGDKWFLTPTGSVTVLYQPDGPVQTPNALPGATANAAIQAAFNVWLATQCTGSSGNGRPNFRLQVGSYPTRDRGDNPVTLTFRNVVYFVTPNVQWEADPATVALTTTAYQTDNQFDVGADMEFNNINFSWRVGSSGCNAANANCYDVETVALHEVGHFIGFNHVACQDAVMYPSALGSLVNTSLSHHEQAGICALYPPRVTNTATAQQGEACTTQTDCSTGLDCIAARGRTAADANAWCAKKCSSTAECGSGWVCGPVGPYSSYCHPGFHLPDIPVVDNVTSASDLCAPCTDGAQCSTGQCGGRDSLGNGLCTQTCGPPSYACPDGFDCSPTNIATVSNCMPTQPDTCKRVYSGAILNDICVQPATSQNPNGAVTRDCAAGLNCVVFATGVGACVQACSAVDPSETCAAGYHCCYGVDATTGQCLGSAPTRPNGGCFETRHLGDACVVPNQSVCDANTMCFAPGAADAARCYDFCPNGTCAAGETCVTKTFSDSAGNAMSVCCDAALYNSADPTTCVPHAGPCLREVGVQCSNNSDCQSNLCLKYAGTAVCSVACTDDSVCPPAGADLNDDGVADAGTHCGTVGSNKYCLPLSSPALPPLCATSSAVSAKSSNGCGNCAQANMTSPEGLSWGAVLLLCAWRVRRYKAFFRRTS